LKSFILHITICFFLLTGFIAKTQVTVEFDNNITVSTDSSFTAELLYFNYLDYDFYNYFDTLYIRRGKREVELLHDSSVIYIDSVYVWPYKGNVISDYGIRGGRMHTGVDIRLNHGDTVYAIFDGVVRISRSYSGYGKTVLIRHNKGIESLYSHLSKLLVSPNDSIKAGTPIGLGGRTGRASCTHLHFEFRLLGEPINPNAILDFENYNIKNNVLIVNDSLFKNHLPAKTFNQNVKINTNYHYVKQGETLYSISRKYNTSVKVLRDINNLKENSILNIGQMIKLPMEE